VLSFYVIFAQHPRRPRRPSPNLHGIISFADPHPLTTVESYRFKKGGGRGASLGFLRSNVQPSNRSSRSGRDVPPCFRAIPFLFKPLRTLLRSRKTQLFSFQSFPHSLRKTTGGGGCLWLTSSPLGSTFQRSNRRSPIGSGRSYAQPFPISHLPYALPSSVSCKPFICHSYENTGGVGVFFPLWNSSHGVGGSTYPCAIIGFAACASAKKASRE
jgi:hypothetical protein